MYKWDAFTFGLLCIFDEVVAVVERLTYGAATS